MTPGILLVLILIVAEVVLKYQFEPTKWINRLASSVWVDGRYRTSGNIDTFYDRIVTISLVQPGESLEDDSKDTRLFYNEITGVLLTKWLILTSYNAFKTASQRINIKQLDVSIMRGRYFDVNGTIIGYRIRISYVKVTCGRQVIPPRGNQKVPTHMRHGKHSPIHDLMVVRMNTEIHFLEPIPQTINSFENYKEGIWSESNKWYYVDYGPIRTDLAKPNDVLNVNDLKFASFGHLSNRHIKENRYLETGELDLEDKILANCDEWIPKEWGHFICIQNMDNYPGIASGGMLFSDDKLFGVGCFALWKGKTGILVFTDVRPYWHLLYHTCTISDQNLEYPKDEM